MSKKKPNEGMILNIEDIPYVVITNGKTDESKRILETLEKKPEKLDITTHRELVILFFLWLNYLQKGTKKRKGIRELAHIMYRMLYFGQKQNPTKEMSVQSIETEIFNTLKFLKEEKKGTDKDLGTNILDEIKTFFKENV
ncbi:hypothetical protein [Bacteroides fragilis]|uniref:hypothetical protein n=2 Tax=Bacteroides TaxID=816 RepID=UPI00203087D9|nr:hypothetical protein [Bacteroides fragilis]